MPRIRFKIQTLMIAVVLVALLSATCHWIDRNDIGFREMASVFDPLLPIFAFTAGFVWILMMFNEIDPPPK